MEWNAASRRTGPELAAPARIYLARHGRTALNAAGVLRGRLDPPLDAVGRQEAAALGAALGSWRVARIVASPMRRAVETAAAVGSACGTLVRLDARLTDRDYGQWAGRRKEDVESEYGSLDAAPGVEPEAAVAARAMAALGTVARQVPAGVAVVVSHDVVIRRLLVACDPRLGSPDAVPQDTGHFNVLEFQSGAWAVLEVNRDPSLSR